MPVFVKASTRGKSAVKAYVRSTSASDRTLRKHYNKGNLQERAEVLREKLGTKMYRAQKMTYSGTSSRVRTLQKRLATVHTFRGRY